MKEQKVYFPMFFDISDKTVVVFGAGDIAYRRVNTLLKTGCKIILVAPNIKEEFYTIESDRLEIIKDIYKQEYLYNANIVLAITNDKNINDKIYIKCREKNIIVNVASDKEKCDFFFPAFIQQDGCSIGVCGDGSNHKLVRNISDKIRKFFKQEREKDEA